MKAIENTIGKLQSFLDNQDRYMEEAFKQNETIIKEQNVYQMYEEGINRHGKSILPPYSPQYERRKRAKGQRTDHVTLRDTGAFHQSIRLAFFNEGFEVVADDVKTPHLTKRYEGVLGITDDALKEICDQLITPYLRDKLHNLLQ